MKLVLYFHKNELEKVLVQKPKVDMQQAVTVFYFLFSNGISIYLLYYLEEMEKHCWQWGHNVL